MGTLTATSPHRSLAGRVLYGMLFAVILPVALTLWAHASASLIDSVIFKGGFYGPAVTAVGMAMMIAGMLALWRRGGGLPMNAFPPPRFVASGIYNLVPHPIYVGFVLACGGVAMYAGSASGLWLVAPAVALCCCALVLGYEMPDLRNRFGPPHSSPWLPPDRDDSPSRLERLRIYLVVIAPWCVGFQMISYLGIPTDAVDTYLPLERSWPVIQWTEVFYFSIYVVVLLFPLVARSARVLRRFAAMAYIAMATLFPLYLLLPFYAPPRPFVATTLIGQLLQLERCPVSGAAAFPSFHVVWTCIVASAISQGSGWKKAFAWTWALLVAASCVATGMHSIFDVAGGFAAFVAIVNMPAIWRTILHTAERIANSWREWRVGPVRIINHGAYAGLAAAVGMFIIDTLLGPGAYGLTLAICIGAVVGAALWAQWVEGSPALLRPLGFYGGMLGSMGGATMALKLHLSLWSTFAAICVAAPWIQALGRLRCLVQGCCHGRPVQFAAGIRYSHPRSRVCRIAHFDGVSVHATPVYSILWNLLVGAALLRLQHLHARAAILCGVYLLLSGAGRFVEEAYRGEPQTRILAGLRFYQWIAIVCVVSGAALTCLPNTVPLAMTSFRWSSVGVALVCGFFAWFVSGVDFPESSRRFARLT